ncbi:MAG TPA: hypothetical protein VNL72_05505 [Gammaproteobacteria bacterium]|nr:hypothetical protein [Gammaproteobacteria bacterium]
MNTWLDPESGEIWSENARFLTVGVYETFPDAHIALGKLAAEGIEAHLDDAHVVQADWLYALAFGGIKLRVAAADAERARRILAADHSAALDDLSPPA